MTQDDAPALPASEMTGSIPLGAYIEPVHLQIVCRQLWSNLPSDRTTILDEDVQAFGDVDQALIGFYQGALKNVLDQGELSERRLRAWFDHSLITPARTRGLVYRGESDSEGLPNVAVDVLNDAYIIRANIRGNDTWYELAHDRLVEPILTANREWLARYQNPLARAAEAWVHAGRDPDKLFRSDQLKEVQAQIDAGDLTDEEREFVAASQEAARIRQVKRIQRLLLGGGVLLLVFAVLTIWSISSAVNASRLNAIAEARWWSFVAVDNMDTNPDLSLLLSIHAVQRTHKRRAIGITAEAQNALHRILKRAGSGQYALPHQAQTTVSGLAFGPNSDLLATAGSDGSVYLWDLETGELSQELAAHSGQVRNLAFSPDEPLLATAGTDRRVILWDTDSYEQRYVLTGHLTDIYAFAFSPDSEYMASADAQGIVKVWNVLTGQLVFSWSGHTDAISAVTFSPDGQRLATASADKTARIWDVQPESAQPGQSSSDFERALLALSEHTASVNAIAFSPDGKRIATASADRTAIIWDAKSGRALFRLLGHTASVADIAFSPNGKLLATASADGTAKVWDVRTGREQTPLVTTEQLSPVRRVAFNPSSTRLASANQAGTVRIWSLPAGKEVLTFDDHRGDVTSLAFSDDGAYLGSAGADNVARLYVLAADRLLDIACSQAGRNLTQDEWNTYIGTGRYRQTCWQQPVHSSAILKVVKDQPGAIARYVRWGWRPRVLRSVDDEQIASALVDLAAEHTTMDDPASAMTALDQAVTLAPDLNVEKLAKAYARVCALARSTGLREAVAEACQQAVALAAQTENLALSEGLCQTGSGIDALAQAVRPACLQAEGLKKTEDLAIAFAESPNFNARPPGTAIQAIVVGASANNSLDNLTLWFQNPQASASAHYAIGKDGKIVQYVRDSDRAWHAGKSEWQGQDNVNDFSIGIQLVNLNDGQDLYPQTQRQALVALCVNLAAKYSISTSDIVGRKDVSLTGRSDPVGLDIAQLQADVEAVLSGLNSYEQAGTDAERLQALAELFALGSVYAQEATNRFYGLDPAQQVSLFQADLPEELYDELERVIRNVYVTLDRMADDQDLAVMEAMVQSLRSTGKQDVERLADEIAHWKTGRERDNAEQFAEAAAAYGEAIALNGNHPVIIYDRALAYLDLEDYDGALSDLSQVVRIAGAIQEQQQSSALTAQAAEPAATSSGAGTQLRFASPAQILDTVQATIQEDGVLLDYLQDHIQAYPYLASTVAKAGFPRYIYGLHDPDGEWLMEAMDTKGWIVFPERLGRDPNDTSSQDYSAWADSGFGVIVRIDHDYAPGGTIPRRADYADFGLRVHNFVENSKGAQVWIVGNEPNHVQSRPQGQAITPQLYAEIFKIVWEQIHAIPGHENDQVIVAPIAPLYNQTTYTGNRSGDWVQYMVDVLNEIRKLGTEVDGIALHTHTSRADPALVTSDRKMSAPFQSRFAEFRAYRDFMEAIPQDLRHVPVYITETTQGEPWLDENSGWVQAAYQEIDDWNNTPGNQQIRALVLYRWPRFDEYWHIEDKEGVYDDFIEAMANEYVWSEAPLSAPEPGAQPTPLAATPTPTPTPRRAEVGDLEVEFIASPHFNERPADSEIWALVLHASAGSSMDALIRLTQNPSAFYSVHYAIDKDGRVVQFVDDEMRAWHSGASEWLQEPDANDYSIGIELINRNDGKDPYPGAQLEALVDLCVELVLLYDIDVLDIVGHYQISLSGKTDPVGLDIEQIQRDVAARTGQTTQRVTPTPAAAPTVTATAAPTATPTAVVQATRFPRTIFGLHEPGGEWLMDQAGKRGWIVFPERLGRDPEVRSGRDYSAWTDSGFGVIVRIDHDYSPGGTIPLPDGYDDFAQRVRNFVENSAGAHIWVIGQEPNRSSSRPDGQPITPQLYAQVYQKIWRQVHALPGHENDQVVVAPIAPWNAETAYAGNEGGDWVKYMVDVLAEIQALGATADAIALHTYTHSADPALITADTKLSPPYQNYHGDFRAYRDFMNAIPQSLRRVPVYITETNQGNLWLDENNGWVQAAYQEIGDWNRTPGNQQIRALVLYRWPKVDGWHIEDKSGVYEDLLAAMANDHLWFGE